MKFCKHCCQFIVRKKLSDIKNPLVKKLIKAMDKYNLTVDEISDILKVNMDEYTDALIEERNKLTSMLIRVMEEIEYQEPGIILDDDVKEWWAKSKSNLYIRKSNE
jgi:site-specific DNA-adenine methylase